MIFIEIPASSKERIAQLTENTREVFHDHAALSIQIERSRYNGTSDIFESEGGHLTIATVQSSTSQLPSAEERAAICARTARDHKARDILVLDMRGRHPLYDYFVICTGSSRRQIHTLAEEIDDALRAVGDRRDGIEGYQASKWIVQDYGDILFHVFDPETRAYYQLEDLWNDAPRMDWERV